MPNPGASLETRVQALEQQVTTLTAVAATLLDKQAVVDLINVATAGPFEGGGHLGFDISDVSHGANNRQRKSAPDGEFITDVETYIEDNHIKLVFYCKKISRLVTTSTS